MVEVPDQLVERLGSNANDLAELIESGLRVRNWPGASSLVAEVVNFLATGPDPESIVAFHPSAAGAERARELLNRNREGSLTAVERAELDEMALLDQFMTLVKARAFEESKAA